MRLFGPRTESPPNASPLPPRPRCDVLASPAYIPSPLPHLYFTAPFLWVDLKTFDGGTKKVTWLLAVPISDSERSYLREHGPEALERLFEERQLDIFNVNRAPVV